GHRDIVWHADFAPDGERVVTGSRDETVGVWEVPRGPSPSVMFTPLAGHGHIVWCVEVSSDGAHVVSAGGDGTARVWSLADLDAPPQVLGGHTAVIYQASFDAAGERVITASADGTARVYWVGEDRPPLVLADHTRPVERAVFSPDGEHALTASLDGTARLWTLTGAVSSRVLQHTEGVESVAFSPDGQLAATGSRDRTVGLWRVADGVRVHALRGHTREVFRVRFSPDSQRLASGSFDGTARVWELDALPRSRRYAVHDGIIRGLFETPGGAALTTADDGLARLTRLASARDPLRDRDGVIKTFAGATLATYPAALSPDGAWLLVGAADGRVRLYPFDDDARASPTQPSATAVMGAPLRTVAISPDGQLAAAADNDGRAHVWRLAELAAGRARPLAALPLPDRASGQVYTNALIFTRDGAELITVGHGGVNRSWSIEQILAGDRELAPAREEDGHARTIRGATLSPDGRLLASYSSDRTARVWNLETGAVQVLEGHVGEVTRLSFDGDGRRVVTASNDGTARVWILGEDASPVVLGDRLGETRDARFSPGGARVATATDAGLVQLWSAEGGDPITLPGHVGAVSELLFVDGGEHLLSAGEDGALRLWYVGAEDDDAAALARRLARRTTACLTAEQRARLLGERPELAAQRRDACARRHGRR
ncbi:MAG: WD40 repeat domain-containing protein, partial [Nannocystaceae bacterium]